MKREKKQYAFPAFLRDKSLAWIAGLVSLIALFGTLLAFQVNALIGIIWVTLVVVSLLVIFKTLKTIGEYTAHYINKLSYRVARAEQEATLQMPVGILLYDQQGNINWINPFLQNLLDDQIIVGESLTEVVPDLVKIIDDWGDQLAQLEADGADAGTYLADLTWAEHQFKVKVQPDVKAVYLFNNTESARILQNFEDHRLVIGLVSVDNYDELTESMSDADSSALRTFVTRSLLAWMSAHDMYVRRISVDRYLVVGYRSGLHEAELDKFSILDNIREATSAQNTPLTLSIGLSYGEESITHLAENAQADLDLALGRGGDQVVVRAADGEARFYGGTTNPMAKRTRVRARVISQALADLFEQADQIFIVGHARPDMDSFGAALGVRRLAEMRDRPAWVVYDERETAHSDIQLLLANLAEEPRDEHAIISPAEALKQATSRSLLVMVDHSKPSISEDQALYEKLADRVVIIDHHRRGEEFPEEPQLVYVESYASSTSELVTELFEYQPDNVRGMTRIEATAMLAGIQIDTKSFTVRSGTRTFDAASYLRSVGADGQLLQEFMKESLDSYRNRSHLIERVQLHGTAAISVGEDDIRYDSVVAAQAADSLMQLIGVKASFVITRRDDETIAISARSDGTENVQLIMEQMGGGGHLSNAATQLKDVTTEEADQQLVAILDAQAKAAEEE